MYWTARHDHFHMVGMPLTWYMNVGMLLIGVGVALVVVAIIPKKTERAQRVSKIKIGSLDDTKISKAHVALLLVLAAAITIDVMKSTSLAFIAPGAAVEYNLRGPLNPHSPNLPVALYPLIGITGTMIGSFLWGWFGDRIGRRASILLSAILFIATTTCGTMPEYWLNLVSCFFMGVGVGGMLPITFALMSETIPKRHRSWLMVLIGSDIAGAYIIVSWLASTIAAPDRFGWRMLWLVGLPSGLLLILLNRWMPESPRFLLQQGRDEEARAVMARYGAAIIESDEESDLAVEQHLKGGISQLFTRNFLGLSAAIILLALSIGMTQYGFQQWMPSNLQHLGFSAVHSTSILRNAALLGFPFSLPVALLYGFWSTKKTVLGVTVLMAGSLGTFAFLGDSVVENSTLLYVLLVIPIWGISLLNSVLAAYTAEVYPTVVRARGSGMSAGATKTGGVAILFLVVIVAAAAPSVRMTAALGLIPMVLAGIVLLIFGPETRHRQLESITAEALHLELQPVAAGAR
ncbi:MFS transporter [Rhizocola hellebori]|nr:MFS transporter [Rhizocola hellebori]